MRAGTLKQVIWLWVQNSPLYKCPRFYMKTETSCPDFEFQGLLSHPFRLVKPCSWTINDWVLSISMLWFITGILIASTWTNLETQPFSSLTAVTAENRLILWLLHVSLRWHIRLSISLRWDQFRATTNCIRSVYGCGIYGMRSHCCFIFLHAEIEDNWAISQSQWSVALLTGAGHIQILLYLLWVLL